MQTLNMLTGKISLILAAPRSSPQARSSPARPLASGIVTSRCGVLKARASACVVSQGAKRMQPAALASPVLKQAQTHHATLWWS